MICVGACLARNEAKNYLARVIANAAQFCDIILLVDDHSTDGTPEVASAAGAHVVSLDGVSPTSGWWGADERPARQKLWLEAAGMAGPDGWIYIFDADHELLGITPRQFKKLLTSNVTNAWSCPLWDAWDSEDMQRVDGFWYGWKVWRPWVFRAKPTSTYIPSWGRDKTIHVGHTPDNYPFSMGRMPWGAGVRHLGYVKKEDRIAKRQKYLDVG